MRITNKTMTSSYLRNLNRNLNNLQKYHNQLSSGKEISKPSDNPMLVSKIMSLRDNILANEQYNKNISDSLGWVKTQDSTLGDVTGTLNRIRDLMIYGANGSQSDTDTAAIRDEIEQQIGQIVDALNTNFDGRYIFSGQHTTTRPFRLEGGVITYRDGEDKNISREISTGVSIDLITSGTQIVGEAGGDDLGSFLNEIMVALDSDDPDYDPASLSGKLDKMDGFIDGIIRVRSQIGAIHNRLEASEARNKSENLNLNTLLSEREDIDIAEKYMEFSVMKSVYQASLQTGASILQPTLLDFIR